MHKNAGDQLDKLSSQNKLAYGDGGFSAPCHPIPELICKNVVFWVRGNNQVGERGPRVVRYVIVSKVLAGEGRASSQAADSVFDPTGSSAALPPDHS